MSIKASEVVKQVTKLASMPEICFRISELADDPTTSTHDIKSLIESDPALSAQLLKIANSPFYGRMQQIDDLNRAIMLIGTQGIRDLVWATTAVSEFSKLSNRFVDMKSFWLHSLYTATVARILANKCHVIHKDRLFLAGLLHDIGHLAMYTVLPEEMEVVFTHASENNVRLYEAERNILGFNHAKMSYGVLTAWGLPDSVRISVAYHHQPGKAEDYRLDAAILHLADAIAKQQGQWGNLMRNDTHIDSNAWKISGLSEKIIEPVAQVANEQFNEIVALYLAPLRIKPAA